MRFVGLSARWGARRAWPNVAGPCSSGRCAPRPSNQISMASGLTPFSRPICARRSDSLFSTIRQLRRRERMGSDRSRRSLQAKARCVSFSRGQASQAKRFAEVFSPNDRFHETLYSASGNRQLASAIRHQSRTSGDLDHHFAMIDAVANRDNAALADIVRTHIQRRKDFSPRIRRDRLTRVLDKCPSSRANLRQWRTSERSHS